MPRPQRVELGDGLYQVITRGSNRQAMVTPWLGLRPSEVAAPRVKDVGG